MQMNRGVFLMTNFVLALCLTGSATQKQGVGGDAEIPTAKLVNTMRFLGTSEVSYRGENGRFASKAELLVFFGKRIYWANLPSTSKTLNHIKFKLPLTPTELTTKLPSSALSI